jgi:hypothetical protein
VRPCSQDLRCLARSRDPECHAEIPHRLYQVIQLRRARTRGEESERAPHKLFLFLAAHPVQRAPSPDLGSFDEDSGSVEASLLEFAEQASELRSEVRALRFLRLHRLRP